MSVIPNTPSNGRARAAVETSGRKISVRVEPALSVSGMWVIVGDGAVFGVFDSPEEAKRRCAEFGTCACPAD